MKTLTPSRQSRGFTLIELMAVLLISAVLATTVSISLKSIGRDLRIEDLADQVKKCDAQTRERGRRSGRSLALRFELENRRVVRVDASGQSQDSLIQWPAGPSAAFVSKVITSTSSATDAEQMVSISIQGRSPTYAIQLGDESGRRRWIVFAGMTGATRDVSDDAELREIFELVETGRNVVD